MKAFKIVLNAIIVILALQSLFTLINVTLTSIMSTGVNAGAVGTFSIRDLMYPVFFLVGITYYKKTNEKTMIAVSSIGLISKLLLLVFTWARVRG